ncbi:DUF6233 domain-containing protein [Streptomyces neyagawaensis]|uniref:DUF6233 domain-containing protein n=1 Tax=Streptomyces neyagawaensis TaxID=42238 RepID=UPI00197D5D7E|nr:DUF6233 domain-containing protein [Streptomyces neyagawaensis]
MTEIVTSSLVRSAPIGTDAAGARRTPCTPATAGQRPRAAGATRQQAIDALRQQVPPCIRCRPDTALGILD